MNKPDTDTLSKDFIKGICTQLARNAQVRRKLPQEGRVHIDRQLPFLAVYRRPPDRPDPGTDRLLLGEASYLLASGDETRHGPLNELIKAIVKTQGKAFDAFLVLEIWSAETKGQEDSLTAQKPAFRIFAPEHDAPVRLLEELENALLDISVAGQPAEISLVYQDEWTPPGLSPLLSSTEIQQPGCTVLGMEVRPIYRNSQTGEIYPFELNTLHHGLARALKQGFYAFTHGYTRHRPAHYHELGRRAMTSAVREADQRLAEIDSRFDILLHVTPVNTEAAWAEFKHQSFEREPEFHYRPRPVDPALVKRELYQIPIERIEDPTLAYIFAAKREELDRQLTLIGDRATARFLPGSIQIFGRAEPPLLQLARELLDQLPPDGRDDQSGPAIDAAQFAEQARSEIEHYRQVYPDLSAQVELRDDVPGVMVSRGHLLVNRHLAMSASRAPATLAHEVGTHIVTFYNGKSQPFRQLYAGMANYEPLQEGLGVLSEYLVGGLSRSRLRLLAGRVVAVQYLTDGAGFIETFRELLRHGFSEGLAFTIAMRVYRGGGYTKDAVYLRGLAALLEYLKTGGDLELLYLGKFALEHVPFIEELRWRQVLKPNLLRPRHLDDPQVDSRLERLRKGLSLHELIEN